MKRLIVVGCLFLAAVGGSTIGIGHGVALADTKVGSEAATACSNGGYATITGVGGTTFSNSGACVSYAARGGAFFTVTVLGPDSTYLGEYDIQFTGVNLMPGATVYTSLGVPIDDFSQNPVTVQGNGVLSDSTAVCSVEPISFFVQDARGDTLTSNSISVPC